MENLINWISVLGGMYLIVLAFILETKNIQSTIVFKVIPFFTGICILISMFQHMGFIHIF